MIKKIPVVLISFFLISFFLFYHAPLAAQDGAVMQTVSSSDSDADEMEVDQKASAKRPIWVPTDYSILTGYRSASFRTQIAGDAQGMNPNIAVENTAKEISIYQLQAEANWLLRRSVILRGSVGYGWILDGDDRNSRYTGVNRTDEAERLDGTFDGSRVFDFSGALGYELKPSKRLHLTPLVGYAYRDQEFSVGDVRRLSDSTTLGMEEGYVQHWRGPWAGGEASYQFDKGWRLFGRGAYHWGKFDAQSSTDFFGLGCPETHEDADMNGVTGRIGLEYAYSRRWSIDLALDLESFWTSTGINQYRRADGSMDVVQLNEARWRSWSLLLGITYHFDDVNEEWNLIEHGGPVDPSTLVKISGNYRLSAGINREQELWLNEANADWQEKNFRYLFGEHLENTYDPAIYQRFLMNVDFAPTQRVDVYTQIVADPWSYVGTTGEQLIRNQDGTSSFVANFKYFGAFNSVLNEIYRANTADSIGTPLTKVIDGQITPYSVRGFTDYGTIYNVPAYDLDYEFRPIRKFWFDYNADEWHARVFPLADERQALTTDDPLELSNHRDYWQQSPWLYQYVPPQFFSDGSMKRGYYSDSLSFMARDSDGNRLVLLRGASVEADLGDTYLVGTIAAPFTPWDPDFFEYNNIPGAFRVKRWATDRLMVGSTYTFRAGMISDAVSDLNQVLGVDAKYKINQNVALTGEMAGSRRQRDMLTSESLQAHSEGYAYRLGTDAHFDHKFDGHTDFLFHFTQMDAQFEPSLSRYSNTRDDRFWGKHISFTEYSPELEYFRLGNGIDVNRMVFRVQWREKVFKDRFMNLMDLRNVRNADNLAFKENVFREEATLQITPKLKAKGLFRWHDLPKTMQNVEPFLSNFYFPADTIDLSRLNLQNTAIPGGVDPSRYTYSAGLQYIINKQWTVEGIFERTNDVPDFPRGLLNGTFRDRNDVVEGILLDHVTTFLYGQSALEAVPPYNYFNIVRERIIYRPDDNVTFTFHAAQNGYKYAGGIDDTINHQGISVSFNAFKKCDFFFDYTHSMVVDVPRFIATNYNERVYESHHNVYSSVDYRINSGTVFRAEYGVFGMGSNAPLVNPYSTSGFSLPTIDTEHLFRVSLTGEF